MLKAEERGGPDFMKKHSTLPPPGPSLTFKSILLSHNCGLFNFAQYENTYSQFRTVSSDYTKRNSD